MKPNEAADHEWIRQRKARQKNSTKDKKGKFKIIILSDPNYKVGWVFLVVIVSMLPHAKIGRNDHEKGAPQFMDHMMWEQIFIKKNRGQNPLGRAAQNLMFNKLSKNISSK